MIKIAISGNIASGKSEVEKIILSHGLRVLDTDKVAHEILSSDKCVFEEIVNIFGTSILDDNGEISRKKLGDIVFSNVEQKKALENIMHPEIKKKINEFFEENNSETLIFVSVPLLFEGEMQKDFDKIIFVSAPENIRFQRLMKRNNLSEIQAKARINSQQNEQSKISCSDFVINNDSNLESLTAQTEQILKSLLILNR